MPKAARRQSGPKSAARSEPYPAIKPGDKPSEKASSKPELPLPDHFDDLCAHHKEAAIKKAEKALQEKSSSDVNKSAKSSSSKKSSASEKPSSAEKKSASFLDLKLDGEDNDSVPIYDTCSEVRRKINALLGKDNNKPENGIPGEFKKDGTPKPYTKAAFVRAVDASSKQLDTFMKAKKMMGGGDSAIYPKAYMFFEKKRIFEGKKKTAGRLKVEQE